MPNTFSKSGLNSRNKSVEFVVDLAFDPQQKDKEARYHNEILDKSQ